jgi:hypothetical protein
VSPIPKKRDAYTVIRTSVIYSCGVCSWGCVTSSPGWPSVESNVDAYMICELI